ncbi:hypothetical protein B0I35DRAFT_146936 [Stachybotrys elegans]|uniref:Uncharacterized protein n=1 Tax=Stachybotrys elegans TaxID=80388 RepID=A0A8K0WL67_9HYPO|nr:hypothetical protein B0I35DRAFT_146936 [Stachybotrys elegans]
MTFYLCSSRLHGSAASMHLSPRGPVGGWDEYSMGRPAMPECQKLRFRQNKSQTTMLARSMEMEDPAAHGLDVWQWMVEVGLRTVGGYCSPTPWLQGRRYAEWFPFRRRDLAGSARERKRKRKRKRTSGREALLSTMRTGVKECGCRCRRVGTAETRSRSGAVPGEDRSISVCIDNMYYERQQFVHLESASNGKTDSGRRGFSAPAAAYPCSPYPRQYDTVLPNGCQPQEPMGVE